MISFRAVTGCGGNPLACKIAITALTILKEEKMAENAEALGKVFREELAKINSPYIKEIRGKGLLNAVSIHHTDEEAAWGLCLTLKENGLLAKPTHGNIIRLAPPLVITEEQVHECCDIIEKSVMGATF